MSLQLLPRPPRRDGRPLGTGHLLRVALAALSITAALAALVAALVLLVSDCTGDPDGDDAASVVPVSQASRNARPAP